MSNEDNKDPNVTSSSSSSSVGPAKVNSVILPIYNQLRLPPTFRDARMEEKMDALDLNIGIRNQKSFVNYGRLDAKVKI
jgi:hypothetical protein